MASMRSDAGAVSVEQEFIVTRLLDASPAVVFRAWTDSKQFKRWWGPKDFTTPHCTIDLRPGGQFHYCMRSANGQEYWGKGLYREIVEPSLLVFTDLFSDATGSTVSAATYGFGADWPEEPVVRVTFEDEAGKTRLTIRGGVSVEAAERYGAKDGWTSSIEKLDALVSAGN